MRRADIDVRLRRHAGVADRMRATEGPKAVLLGDLAGVAEILDQLERAAERQNLRALDLLEVSREPPRVAGIAQPIAEGVRGGLLDFDRLGAKLGQQLVNLGLTVAYFRADMMVLGHILLLGELEPHHILVGSRGAVDGEAG